MEGPKLRGMSLFSNVGIAEAYLEEAGVKIMLANEIDRERARFYSSLYPETEMIVGDITDDAVRSLIKQKAKDIDIDFIIATPPCQGMSKHGKRDPHDPRNQLVSYAIDVIKEVLPKYVLLENVPRQLHTKIDHQGKLVLIPDYIQAELLEHYNFNQESIVDSADYGVPQRRKRSIFLLTRKDIGYQWEHPEPTGLRVTLQEAIGHLPSLDPEVRGGDTLKIFPEFEIKKAKGLKVSKWHYPPTHSWKHIQWMTHTPTGRTAFENQIFYPQKDHGKLISGRISTYKRFSWDKPAQTITQNNGVISSSVCVHPGRLIKDDGTEAGRVYSDARVLSIYELMIVTSLPPDWNIPNWASEKLIRSVIGEGIPPLMIKKIVENLTARL